jgi:predicted DNA-binding transcriptional regulator YafY
MRTDIVRIIGYSFLVDDPTTRALRLLSLLQTQRFWPGAELVRELGVSDRTVRRDVDRLRELGYPVEATPGAGGGYQLVSGASLPPLVLDDDEAVALAVGLRSSAGAAIVGIEAASLSALAKLEQVLPDRLRRRVGAIRSNTSFVGWGDNDEPVDPDALALLAQACRDHEEVRFEYESREGEATRRLVEPHQLVSAGRRWYLVAFDVRRDGWRTFRLDRLTAVQLAGRRFLPRPAPAESFEDFVAESVRQPRQVFEGVVTIACGLEELREFVRHTGATVDELGPDRCRVTLLTESFEWLLGLVAIVSTHGDVTVEGPPELRKAVATIARRLQKGARAR